SSYGVLNPTYYAPTVSVNTNYSCTLTVTNNRNSTASSSVNILVIGSGGQQYTNLSVETKKATDVDTTTATLNGRLLGDNGNYASVRFDYGRNSSVLSNTTPFVYNKRAPETFFAVLSGLEKGKAYYFRAEASSSTGGTVYGSTLSFITQPDSPGSFIASLSGYRINLSWTMGEGACYTAVTRKLNSYPVSTTDGTLVYYGTGTSYVDQNIYASRNYYYRAWSVGCDAGMYSWSESLYSRAYVSTYGMGGYQQGGGTPYVPPVVTPARTLNVQVLGRNLTRTIVSPTDNVTAYPNDEIEVNISVTSADNKALQGVILTNILPVKIDSISNVRLDGKFYGGDVNSSIVLGNIPAGQSKVLTFTMKLASADEFAEAINLLDNVEVNAQNVETVRASLGIAVSPVAGSVKENAGGLAGLALIVGEGWARLIYFLIGLLIALIILLIVYFIIKKMNEDKEKQVQTETTIEKSKYFNMQ
ncbi:MAG: hypothetical protein PHG23_02415, partial [Candidatus Pacebacteria bacterium]|nr:hypothetical protein [Candidatus Paceibacterota bacterium]